MIKEKNDEKKRIFINDLSAYKSIKKDLENKILDVIPPLFTNKFLIFKLLEDDNLLDSDNNYTLFTAMYESDNDSNSDVEFDCGSQCSVCRETAIKPTNIKKEHNINKKQFFNEINSCFDRDEFENNIEINNMLNQKKNNKLFDENNEDLFKCNILSADDNYGRGWRVASKPPSS